MYEVQIVDLQQNYVISAYKVRDEKDGIKNCNDALLWHAKEYPRPVAARIFKDGILILQLPENYEDWKRWH